MSRHMALTLTIDERAELQRRVRSLKIRSEDARRARVILMLADGESYSTIEARVLAKTRQAPPDGSTHWSTRKLGRVLKIHHNLVAKAWQRAGLQPHRF